AKHVAGPAPRSAKHVAGPAPRSAKHVGGFTLVEILLALAILSVVMVLLLASFTGAGRSLEILTERSGNFRQLRITMDRSGSDLDGAFSSIGSEPTAFTCKPDQFSGKPASTLIFTAYVLPDITGARPPSDIVRIKYFPKVSEDGRSIEIHREQSDLPLIENKILTVESRLATRIQGFRVELYDGSTWQTEWPQGGKKWALPRKVRLAITDSLGVEFHRTVPLPLAGKEASGTYSGKRGMAGAAPTGAGGGTPGATAPGGAVPPPPPPPPPRAS
ncbi:MAG: prepilin-type N-terminal cleavage/methylation domain-containing protein, partial [Deltaproteobacteria bacterium]|nr:prepilin-type N-terminal cleavage/methylation domain-containing protein [Deltaproteobacteria bacterium]